MKLFERVKYTAFLVVVVVMAIGFMTSLAGFDADAFVTHPAFVVVVVLVSFVASPWLARRMPFNRE